MAERKKEYEKPPLGAHPQWLAEVNRAKELVGAIARYLDSQEQIPYEWNYELGKLLSSINYHRKGLKSENKN